MSFDPVAIVGRGCVLPGALSPAALWDLVSQGRDVLGEPPGGYWGLRPVDVETTPDAAAQDHTWSTRGGYVRGFEDVFDPSGFGLPADELLALDPIFTWTLHAAREALREAGYDPSRAPTTRGGVILGNLSYPTRGLAEFAEQVWRARSADRPDWLPLRARQRFTSGLPAQLVAEATGLVGESFSLDAACASSLYAMKLACDRLHDGRADVMLAGGINHADDLFLHIGFCALNAMSRTGQSRPFHAGADGLVPAEGAGFVVLKRLSDARAAGDHVYGVIRGVGLSNDGRGRGMLTPSEEGQERAMRAAYAVSGLAPADVSLIECHATGTPLGDATELRSMARVFAGQSDVPLGSIKSNMGHPITASGVAGLLKVTEAMAHGTRPPTLHAEDTLEALAGSPFRLLHASEPWQVDGVRRAGINNFGFGGNNAHLLVEEHDPSAATAPVQVPGAQLSPPSEPVAIVAVGAIVGDRDTFAGLVDAALQGESLLDEQGRARAEHIELPIASLKFPPNDLKVALPQQLITLQTSLQLADVVSRLDRARTGVLMGMQCDAEIARYGARWRLGEWARRGAVAPPAGSDGDDAWIESARDGIIDGLVSAGVLGTMPNIVANRLNSQYDVRGPSYTVSAEQASGTVSLDLAARALRRGEVDAAVVGAVDMSCEPVQQWAASQLLPTSKHNPGDAAVLLVLKRLSDARADGDEVWAILDDVADDLVTQRLGDVGNDLTDRVGHAHAASGLVHVAAAAIACRERATLATTDHPARPWLPRRGERCVEVTTHAFGGQTVRARLRADAATAPAGLAAAPERPSLELYAADDFASLAAAVAAGDHGARWGAFRLSLYAQNPDALAARRAEASRLLAAGRPAPGELAQGVHYGEGAAPGEVAFVFTGPAGAYPQMGRSLLLAAPQLVDDVARRFDDLDAACGWLYDPDADRDRPPVDKLWGSSFLCQTHAALTRDLLAVRADAAIGFCSGETNALFAMGAWEDLGAIHDEIDARGVFTRALGGDMAAVRAHWGLTEDEPVDWVTWRLLADADEVRAALVDEPRAHLTIINAPGDVVIAGDRASCQRAVDRLGTSPRDLGYNIAMHCPEAAEWSGPWRDLHHRPTSPVDGVRFYTNAGLTSYAADADAVADALTGQAMNTVDFPALVERAWADGVRVFIEHGPHDGCSQWISRTLGEREHLAVGLDRFGVDPLRRANQVVATLWAAGVPLDAARWLDTISNDAAEDIERPRALTFPAHLPEVRFPDPNEEVAVATTPAPAPEPEEPAPMSHNDDLPPGTQRMIPAPSLPSVHSDGIDLGVSFAAAPAATPQAQPQARAAAQPQPRPAAARTPAPLPPTPGPDAGPVADTSARWAAYHAGLVQMHEDFLRQQSEVHQRFLAMQHAAMTELTAFATGATTPQALPQALTSAPLPQPAAPAPAAPAPVAARAPAPTPPTPTPTPAPTPAPVAPTPAPKPQAKKLPAPEVVAPQGGKRKANITPTEKREPVGPTFDRAQLAVHADGKISEIFGPEFARQDDHAIQVRMPFGKLLLADRVLGIDAPKGVVGTGTLWTETDIHEDAWYLHEGRMPVGIMIESGQADLMLISWMGADFANNGDRAYRLLGCELTFHDGGLPRPGDTLRYDIHIDGHANQGPIRLFFFHYDCCVNGTPRLSVRGGQAGFFTYEELAGSKGILWTPDDVELDPDARVDAPAATPDKSRWERADLEAFGAGDVHTAFGPEFFLADTHTATPSIQYDAMLFIDTVTDFDPAGGPYGRGYLRATKEVTPDWWVFDGHFKNDPCMPGTMMFEGCVQTMAFYLTAMGYTLNNDGWVFEPVPEVTYKLRCRGQVRPEAQEVVYEVFVREVHDGPYPTLYADLLCTVDGLGAFLCENMGLQLVPGWPMDRGPVAELEDLSGEPIASHGDFEFDHASLLSCALGRPSEAFGPLYEVFDGHRRVARLPGPPYHFMTRIRSVSQPMNQMKAGVEVEVDYVVPPDAWYFTDNADGSMPLAVLMEVGLQPCGWLASYAGCALSKDTDLFFRNLDGTGTQFIDVTPETGRLRSHVNLKTIARAGGNIIVAFDVRMTAPDQGDALVYEMDTVFGFFPPSALAAQAGLGADDALAAWALGDDLGALPAPIDLTTREGALFGEGASLADGRLLMLDRISGWWPDAGEAGLGRIRANKDVVPSEWFFKAHFYQDPVQPGSLGIEALLQVVQSAMLLGRLDEGLTNTRFEAIALGDALTWRYRGQVLPHNALITASAEITEVRREDGAVVATADASLWVDGMRIYHAPNMAMRLAGDPTAHDTDTDPEQSEDDFILESIDEELDASEASNLSEVSAEAAPGLAAASALLADPEPTIAEHDTPETRRFTPGDLDYLDADDSTTSEVLGELLGEQGPSDSDGLVEFSDSTPSLEMASGSGLDDLSSSADEVAEGIGQPTSDSVVDEVNIPPRGEGLDSGEFAVRHPSRSSTPISGLESLPAEPDLDDDAPELEELGADAPSDAGDSEGSSLSESSLSESSVSEELGQSLSSESSEDLEPSEPSEADETDEADDEVEPEAHDEPSEPSRAPLPIAPSLSARQSPATPMFGQDAVVPPVRDPLETPLSGLDALESDASEPVEVPPSVLEEGSSEVGFTMLESSVVDEDEPFAFARAEERPQDRTVVDLSPLGAPAPNESAPTIEVEPSEVVVEQEPEAAAAAAASSDVEEVLDPTAETWLWDHCPTYTAPALPMMSIMDRLAQAALRVRPDLHVLRIEDVALRKWVIASDLQILRTETAPPEEDPYEGTVAVDVILSTWWEAPNPDMSRFDEVARARILLGDSWSMFSGERIALGELAEIPDPYEDGSLFHGPAFQVLRRVERGPSGARGLLDISESGVPVGALNPVLLDGALQIIPHDSLELWWDGHPGDSIAYPRAVESFTVHGPTPSNGQWTTEVRFVEARDEHTPVFDVQISQGGMVWATMRLVEVLFPKGPLGRADGRTRRAFLRDRIPSPGLALSTRDADGSTSLSTMELRGSDWFKGTIAAVYDGQGLSPGALTRAVAVKDHVALDSGTHPAWVEVPDGDAITATSRALPMYTHPVEVSEVDGRAVVRDAGAPALELAGLAQFWREELEVEEGWLGGDIYTGLIERYVDRVVVADPVGFDRLRGQSAIFMGNHETQIESLLVTAIASYLIDGTVVTMANAKHEAGWVGELVRLMFSYPGAQDPENIVYFEKTDPASMLEIVAELKADITERGASFMVHAPGTRAVQAGQPVARMTSLFVDMALELGVPIVPVGFTGGLPVEPLADGKLEFPVDQGSQTYTFGSPIWPDELGALEYARRRQHVLDRINALIPDDPRPHNPRPEWAEEIAAWDQQTGAGEIGSTLFHILAGQEHPGRDALELLMAAESWRFSPDPGPRGDWLKRAARLLFGANGPEVDP